MLRHRRVHLHGDEWADGHRDVRPQPHRHHEPVAGQLLQDEALAAKDAGGREFIREMLEKKEGIIYYPWANSELGDTSAREKVVAYASFEPWQWVIGGGTILAGVIGVSNIMMIAVKERTKEIGIRKSIGAKKQSILLQFLSEAVALSLIGGVTGVAVGVGGGNTAAYFMNTAITFPWLWAGIGLTVCGGIGVIFGLYPAWKAASLDPIEALRYE